MNVAPASTGTQRVTTEATEHVIILIFRFLSFCNSILDLNNRIARMNLQKAPRPSKGQEVVSTTSLSES